MASIMSFSYLEIYFTDPKVNAITAKYQDQVKYWQLTFKSKSCCAKNFDQKIFPVTHFYLCELYTGV